MNIIINSDLTSHIVIGDNEQECFLPNYNPETLVPFGSAEEAEAFANTIGSNPNYFVPKLSDEEKAQLAFRRATEQILASRAAAYPPMSDYLDGVVKGDAVQVQAYVDACLAVKAKYPKPEPLP